MALRRCWFGVHLVSVHLWASVRKLMPFVSKWSISSNHEHLSSPIHPTTPAHLFSLSESLSPIPLFTCWTASFCRSLHDIFGSLVEVSTGMCISFLTCIHCSHCCLSTEWLCLCCTFAIGVQRNGQLLLKILPSYSSRSPFSLLVSVIHPDLQVCKKTCYQPWTLGPSSKGRNSNILGSISMINMRSIESLKYSSVVPQKSAGNCLARSSIRPSRTSARCVLCSSFRFSSLFFLGLNGRVFLLKSCSVWNTLCNVFRLQEKFVERCFQIPP
jgi:hypothetical protein